MKKLVLSIFALGMMAASFTSCEDAPNDVINNMVYISEAASASAGEIILGKTGEVSTGVVTVRTGQVAEKNIKVKIALDNAALTSYNTRNDVEFAMIPTGLSFAIPEGYEIQVRPRSGLAAKNGVTVLNTPGTIDSDYRGEVKVILINHGKDSFTVNNGDRIAQLIVAPVTQGIFEKAEELDSTERGEGGFGSTGVNA